jgi:hypothetical protein
MLYIGSCRYMYGYNWDYFPARLHSTKEVIYFLENISNIKDIISKNKPDLLNCIFGHMNHNRVTKDFSNFIEKKIDKNTKKVVIEISTRKVRYYNNVPLNYFYSSITSFHGLETKILTDDEIENDLIYIVEICKLVFNQETEVHIIPHLNLKTKLCNYISERNDLVCLLERLCIKHDIKFHNIGKYIETIDKDPRIESYMADSIHYSKGYAVVKQFLIEHIIKI